MNYLELLSAVAPVFVVMVAGFLVRRAGWLTAEADASLLRVVVNLLYPCLILHTFLNNPAVSNPANLVLAPAAGFVTVALGYGLSWWAAPGLGIRSAPARRAFAFTAGIGNYGYIALPLLQKLFPAATGVLFLHNVGVETALWTVGIMLLTGTSPREGWRRILNVPLAAIGIALLLNFAQAGTWMPEFVLSAVSKIGAAAIPMGLILTGATFADQLRDRETPAAAGVSWGSCLLRLGVLPALMLATARWLPAPSELRHVLLVQAAMPSAVIPVILCRHYAADAPTALRVVLATSALGLLTIPLWLFLGLRWVG